MSDLIQVFVRDHNRQVVGMTTRWSSVTISARRNDLWTWTVTMTDPADAALMMPPTDAAGKVTHKRGVILRRIQPDGSAVTIMSGWQSKFPDVSSDGATTTWTFTGYDDTSHLLVLLWPIPTAPITSQTDTHDRRTGPISNRLRDYFIGNVSNRLGVNGAAGGNQVNLGATGVSQARFADFLPFAQELTARSVNFQVRQRDTDSLLFLYQWTPVDRRATVRFSPALGTVQGWSSNSTPCTANIAIVGAGGEGVLRRFRRYADAASIQAWGPREVFVDRRDLNPDEDEDWELQAEVAGLEAIEQGAARSSFTLETEFGGGGIAPTPFVDFWPGDRVLAYADADEAQQPIGPVTDDLVEQVDTTYSEAGESGTVRVGSVPDDVDNAMARQIRNLGRRIHGLETRR